MRLQEAMKYRQRSTKSSKWGDQDSEQTNKRRRGARNERLNGRGEADGD